MGNRLRNGWNWVYERTWNSPANQLRLLFFLMVGIGMVLTLVLPVRGGIWFDLGVAGFGATPLGTALPWLVDGITAPLGWFLEGPAFFDAIWDQLQPAGVATVLVVAYLLIGYRTAKQTDQEHFKRFADSLYYLGFVFTLWALFVGLTGFAGDMIANGEEGRAGRIDVVSLGSLIARNGIALLTTIVGLVLRIIIIQFRIPGTGPTPSGPGETTPPSSPKGQGGGLGRFLPAAFGAVGRGLGAVVRLLTPLGRGMAGGVGKLVAALCPAPAVRPRTMTGRRPGVAASAGWPEGFGQLSDLATEAAEAGISLRGLGCGACQDISRNPADPEGRPRRQR